MNRVLGICNLHDGPNLGRLSANTTLGCVTFLGRFGLMDFTLSNFRGELWVLETLAHLRLLVE